LHSLPEIRTPVLGMCGQRLNHGDVEYRFQRPRRLSPWPAGLHCSSIRRVRTSPTPKSGFADCGTFAGPRIELVRASNDDELEAAFAEDQASAGGWRSERRRLLTSREKSGLPPWRFAMRCLPWLSRITSQSAAAVLDESRTHCQSRDSEDARACYTAADPPARRPGDRMASPPRRGLIRLSSVSNPTGSLLVPEARARSPRQMRRLSLLKPKMVPLPRHCAAPVPEF